MDIIDKLGRELLIFDGALGTRIQAEALEAKIPDELNITKPELIQKIHKEYVHAGANVITTNTFGANDFKLKGSNYSLEEIITAGVHNAREVAEGAYVALDIGPLGKMMEPIGDLTFDEAYEQFKKQVLAGKKAGCDLIIIETMTDISEARIAVLAAKENSDLPIVCTMTFNKNGKTMFGVDPVTMVAVLEGLKVDALGINCSFGPEQLLSIVEKIVAYSSTPIIVQPNAGLPIVVDNQTHYDIDEKAFAENMKKMVRMGVSIVGGCCGTTPLHIAECKKLLQNVELNLQEKKNFTIAASPKNPILFEGITIMGEALVPTGRKEYTDALLNKKDSFFYSTARKQKKCGAQIINLNVSVPGVDEMEAMLCGIEEIASSVDAPLQIDSIHAEIIEAALRVYPGKAIINSVNGTEKSMKKIFPIAQKYGSLVIAMTFDERGICEKASERVEIAKKIIQRASEYGIDKKDIIVDCLSLPAKTHGESLMDTLEVVEQIKKLGVKTMLGVANVSFSLPNRRVLDRTYFAMALAKGLDAVMMNVYDKDMLETIEAYRVFTGTDPNGKEYTKKYRMNTTEVDVAPNNRS